MYKSLVELLAYEGVVEDDLLLTFRVEYQDVFGTVHHHDLKENGENIPVTAENRQVGLEFIQKYYVCNCHFLVI